ncbi:MAG: hypothetical protein JRI68_20355 [Deltaproteobacteria bacterium]|nr:hypothetical protein [Deltaproteobacteria bacterium]
MKTKLHVGLVVLGVAGLVTTGCRGVLAIDDFGREQAGGADGDPTEGGGGAATGGAPPSAQFDWCLGFGSQDLDRGTAIGIDGSDHVIVAAVISGPINFGGGTLGAEQTERLAVIKLDPSGKHLASFVTDGTGSAQPTALAIGDDGSVHIVGEYHGGPVTFGSLELGQPVDRDVFVAKLGPDLSPTYAVAFTDAGSEAGQQEQRAAAAVVDGSDGSLVLGGTMAGVLQVGDETLTSAGGTDGFLVKLNAQGTPAWSKRFGDDKDQRLSALAMDDNGNLAVAGSFAGSLDLGGGPLVAAGPGDAFVAKLTGAGAHQLSVRYGSSASDTTATAIALSDAGGIVVVGQFVEELSFGNTSLEGLDGEDIYVASLDDGAELDWAVGVAGSGPDRAHAVALGTDGSVHVAGSYSGILVLPTDSEQSSQGGQDALVFKLTPAGDLLWAFDFGRNDDDQAFDMTLDSQDGIVLTGGFHSGLSVNGTPLLSAGAEDIFITKLAN